ncbi:MAG TPA: sigma-70 family RNA polymerase sigma factor [Gemmataceae bacterium]|jgi:RNA polymerase sigma-70 factor (ECF subfamily)|nr:sigma-70 family RNA polymerase sigma factor [Gemmataceae bacterium]
MDAAPPDPAVTEQLLRQVRDGDRAAVEELFQRHRSYLRLFIELRLDPRLRQRVDPSDVVQEAQLEAVRRLAAYLEQPAMPFRLWLRQIAHDHVLKVRRFHRGTARRSLDREVPLPERSSLLLVRHLLAAGSTPSQKCMREELLDRLRQAMTQLPEADREIVLLRTVEGLSYQEIGYLLGIEAAAARKRQGRALVRLHKILFTDGLTETPHE